MKIQNLLDQAEEERQLCKVFGNDPWQSRRYCQLMRDITIKREQSIPAVRITKRIAVAFLIVAIPITLIAWADIITKTIKLLIS